MPEMKIPYSSHHFERKTDGTVEVSRANNVQPMTGEGLMQGVPASIIIPSFNNLSLIQQCLQTIRCSENDTSCEIIAVDNGSTDGTADFLTRQQNEGRLRVVLNEENEGFARACNQGAQIARGCYLVFLNNDTTVTDGWLQAMLKAAQQPGVGIVGAKLLYPDGTIQHAGMALIGEHAGKPLPKPIPGHPHRGAPADLPVANRYRELDMVTGACMVVPKDLFARLGGFDEAFRNGMEDVDLCLRVRCSGHKVVYQPEAVVYHLESRSSGRLDRDQSRRNLEIYFARWSEQFDFHGRLMLPSDDRLILPEKSLYVETKQREEFDMSKNHPLEKPISHGLESQVSGNEGSLQDWLQRGESAFSAGSLGEAKRCYERALQLAPFDAKVHNDISVIHWQEGNIEESLQCLTRAMELDPDDQDVILNCINAFKSLGKNEDAREVLETYLNRKPWDSEVRRELDKLEALPDAVVSPDSSIADFFNDQGEQRFEAGKTEHARACFEMAIDNDERHARAHNNLGVLLWQEGNLEKALEHLYQALDLNPEDSDILNNSAKALLAAGQADTAADLMRLYLQRTPRDEAAWEDYNYIVGQLGGSNWTPNGHSKELAGIYITMGKDLAQHNDCIGAAEAFQRASQLDPDRCEPYHQLARLHFEQGQTEEALELLEEVLKKEVEQKESILEVGNALITRERIQEARLLYETFLKRHSDDDVEKALNDAVSTGD